jgi:hypothetical protein
VNRGENFLPLLLREWTQVIAERARGGSSSNEESKRLLSKNLRLREESLHALVLSVGLIGIPQLSDLQARALRKNSDELAKRVKSLLHEVVKREEFEKESAKIVGDLNSDEKMKSPAQASPSAAPAVRAAPAQGEVPAVVAPSLSLPTRPTVN